MVMVSAFFKDIYREILHTKGRFFGIMAIVALGVAFFAGLGATGRDMRLTGDNYFDLYHLMDIRVVSTYGLNQNDLRAIAEVPGVRTWYAAHNMDAQITHNGSTANIKLHSYDAAAGVNRPILLSGTFPRTADEAVVEEAFIHYFGYAIGDTFTLTSGKSADIRNQLRTATFTITGVIASPYYISRERGASSIGSGETDFYMLIPQENFLREVYSEVFIIAEGTEAVLSFDDTYKERVETVVDALEAVGKIRAEERAREMTAAAYARLQAAEETLENRQREAQLAFEAAALQLSDADKQIAEAYAAVTAAQAEIQLQAQALDENLAEVTAGLSAVYIAESQLDEQERSLRESYATVMANATWLGAEYPERLRDVTDGLAAVAAARSALADQRQSLYTAFDELSNARQQLDAGLNEALDGNRQALSAAYAWMEQTALAETEQQRTTAELEAARKSLAETRKALDDLDTPEWFVLDRDTNLGYASYSDDSDKIEAIGRVFPLIFYIVAALVSLTAMTRLVEERRTEMGTLKSLGYGNIKIISKYIIYAAAPTLTGGLVGGAVGLLLFPRLIIDAYNMLYAMPIPITPLHADYWAAGIGMGVLCTCVAAMLAAGAALRGTPSTLMRPRAPKAGKRTLLEMIPFIWQLLLFTHKVTARNLMRYKKRFLMTVIGIAGCTALLLTGFGLRDSIADIIGKQFGDINHYNMVVSFTDSARENDVDSASDTLSADRVYQRSMKMYQKMMDAGTADGRFQQMTLVVPENPEALAPFISLQNRITQETFILDERGVVITEKLARLLSVEAQDEIILKDGDDYWVTVKVIGITENYFMHYVYMTPALYESGFKEKPVNNALFAVIREDDPAARHEMAKTLLDKKGVNGISFVQSIRNNFDDIIQNLNFVIYVLIISAGTLALIVLLNLTNINISERIRELATIEVLGFYDNEVAAYIYRENAVLTVIGTAAGLLFGQFLHQYVILTAETDIMMFGREIKPASYLFSVVLTLFFSFLVNLLTSRKLKKINMVEALKSVE